MDRTKFSTDLDTRSPVDTGGSGIPLIALALSFFFVFFVLVMPNERPQFTAAAFLGLPLELPVLLILFALTPTVLSRFAVLFAAVATTAVLLLKLADLAAFEVLARAFNPILDFHLVGALWNLLSGTFGLLKASLAAVALIALLIAVAVIAYLGMRTIQRTVAMRRPLVLGLAASILVAGLAAPRLYPEVRSFQAASFQTADLMAGHGRAVMAGLRDLEDFRREASRETLADIARSDLLSSIKGRNVFMIFVESYGRTVIDDRRYAPHVLPYLAEFAETVKAEGYRSASGYLTSPVVGGQSWLGHASVLSGLWVDSQRRYNSLVVSDRSTLVTDFQRAGWKSVAIMPAITMAWPEGQAFGYDKIYDRDALGYAGLPFNWVTMPDQYTLSALQRLELGGSADRPVFAEVALISSHAPWTPIPEMIAWEDVGDGSVFDVQARSGDTPREVWSDPDRVRTQYRLSIEYALENLTSFVRERLDEPFLMIILGDHQPARIITGESDNRDVPIHVISDSAPIVGKIAAALDLTDGMIPPDINDTKRMSVFRERFIRALSDGGGQDDQVAGRAIRPRPGDGD